MTPRIVHILPEGEDAVISFAAQELARYLCLMGHEALVTAAETGICLRVMADAKAHPADDGYTLSIREGQGAITGKNPRSVLLGVYGYLRICGCAFLFPGIKGEIIPRAALADVEATEIPDSRYRCMSIEGACARENVLDMLDWLPKVGMNSYHFQLLDGYTFYQRWYAHARNPHKEARPITPQQTAEYIAEAVTAAKRRGLLVQYMGHGWTSELLGVTAKGWEKEALTLPPETLRLLAMVGGRRQVWKDIPVDTNGCYANPEVRTRMVEAILRFACAHPETDLLHVWLGDDINNYCECEDCRAQLPSDWYVMLLNALDEALTEAGIGVQVVFLVYSELLWAPLQEKLQNPARFVLLFAPVSLDYTVPFSVPEAAPPVAPFILNDILLPESAAENVSYLRAWQQAFPGDSFVYIYHLLSCGWEKDVSGLFLAKLMHADIRQFAGLGLQGTSSCQAQRSAFPTGLVQYVMARTLWCHALPLELLLSEYCAAAFGDDAPLAVDFLETMLSFFPPDYLQGKTSRQCAAATAGFARVAPFVKTMLPPLRQAAARAEPARRFQWRMLEIYAGFFLLLGPLFQHIAAGVHSLAIKAEWESFMQEMFLYEDELQTVFDMEWFVRNFELFEIRGFRHFVNDAPPWEEDT